MVFLGAFAEPCSLRTALAEKGILIFLCMRPRFLKALEELPPPYFAIPSAPYHISQSRLHRTMFRNLVCIVPYLQSRLDPTIFAIPFVPTLVAIPYLYHIRCFWDNVWAYSSGFAHEGFTVSDRSLNGDPTSLRAGRFMFFLFSL